MADRRERNKCETFASIVETAGRTFDDIGYVDATIEMIAAAANVSPGTVYNYFGTKHALLAAVATRSFENVFEETSAGADVPMGDPVAAITEITDSYIRHMVGLGRPVLRDLLRAAFDPTHSELLADLVGLDERAVARVRDLLSAFQAQRLISIDTDPRAGAMLVYSIVTTALLVYVSMPAMELDEVEAVVHSQVQIVFQLWTGLETDAAVVREAIEEFLGL